ncbi:acyl-CoA dehydrogenase family protein [Haliea salexigens]|uniref:acyl-CoA dehydrogenase family protein n=1 Tax=Haliea salexigens TaxID=287487 RepID=UPI00041BE131|nr:acyl-CoA dehydrogenase [Haliea salexigens]
MTQPKNYGFGEEAALLKESARKFFREHFTTDKLHALVASDPTPERAPQCQWDETLWRQLVELGWTMLAVPEEAGGVGMPVAAVAGLVEEVGRAAFPCPLLGTLNATYVLVACKQPGATALADIASGAAATLALTNRHGAWDPAATEVEYRDGALHGTAWFVQDALKCNKLLVCASTAAGHGLFWVDAAAVGVTVQPDGIVDLTRDQAHVTFDGAQGLEVSGNALAVLHEAMPAIWTLLAADMVGAGEWQLQTTVEYVSTRKQFDRPLGFFQAIKHPLVEVMVQIDEAKSLVYNAACACDSEPEKAAQYAHMAKASASDMAAYASSRSVQSHGGIGFTWECYVHLYFKRQKHSQMLWGDAAWHRARLADIVIGSAA